MIPFEQALQIVLEKATRKGTEKIDIETATGRILAEDILSPMEMPPFDKSAMDGYACRKEDLDRALEVIETIPAGTVPEKRIEKHCCAKIMTGSMLPPGADCVIKVEDTRQIGAKRIRFTGQATTSNICYQGEDIKKGELILSKGTAIRPQDVAVLATLGYRTPLVSRLPTVGIIATGDELVEPQESVQPGQIRNSNSYQLRSQLLGMNIDARYYGIARDRAGNIDRLLAKALEENDLILLSGGVSMGDFDLVPDSLKRNGFTLLFESVRIKPGKPTVFGLTDQGKFCFGLPGNPVSTFVVCEILVKPFLYKMMGARRLYKKPDIKLPLEREIYRRSAQRLSWVPVTLTEKGGVKALEYHGSGHINALCQADGLISIPPGVSHLEARTTVSVKQI